MSPSSTPFLRTLGLLGAGVLTCNPASSTLSLQHDQLPDPMLDGPGQTTVSCRLESLINPGEAEVVFDGPVAPPSRDSRSLDSWRFAPARDTAQTQSLALECSVHGPHFHPPRVYHLVLPRSSPFWMVETFGGRAVYPDADTAVNLMVQDFAVISPRSPEGVYREVTLHGTVTRTTPDDSRSAQGAYSPIPMLPGPLPADWAWDDGMDAPPP